MSRSARRLSASLTVALAVATMGVVSTSGGASGSAPPDPEIAAQNALAADASGDLTLRSERGYYDFVGVPAGVSVDDPGVSASTGVRAAAERHLTRYGAALGTSQRGTSLEISSDTDTVTGDVVRFQQKVGGLPVFAGEIVVGLRGNGELDSILAKTSRATSVPDASVTASAAAAKAQASFQKIAGQGGPATVAAKGRWVIDPVLIGASADIPVRTAYRYELSRGAHERRLVLVDDQTGAVLINTDLIGHAKRRIVCDNNQVLQNPNVAAAACVDASANKVRGEGDPVAALAEANIAYDLGGAVHDGFAAFGIADLTELIGRDIGGGLKALSQTVRWCYSGSSCPYANAFWNGSGMYYGTGYAVADDVVGHEMGHGVTERTSNLVYFGQSGAINESLSDIFGEIIDHRNVGAGDTPTSFTLGEDLPIGAIRSVSNPPAFGDPDRTGSALYVKEVCGPSSCYPDLDGVHQNSGVSNKAFYLASQGGTFNGQTITGIDVGDANLTKSGRLWLLVDQSLTSGSDFADLSVILNQACASLQGTGVMTAANCTAVGQAATATELAATPVNNPQPGDAAATCPGGAAKQVLFDSESGTPATKFTAGAGWSRNGTADWGQIAHSAPDAWSNQGTGTVSSRSLTTAAAIALPAGQQAYLHFHQWRVLDYVNSTFYDGGTVEINGAATAGGTWVNGPASTITSGSASPIAGQLAFGGDSRGYTASRLDLTPFAGTSVTPRFTLHSDNSTYYLGWWLDDITVYTCQAGPNTAPAVNAGADATTTVGALFTSSGSFTDDAPAGATATVDYGDGAGPQPLTLVGTTFSLSRTYATAGAKTVTVKVTDAGALSGTDTATVTVNPAPPVLTVTAGTVTIKGKTILGKKLKAKTQGWAPSDVTFTYVWLRNGKVIQGATAKKYTLTNKDKGKKIQVRVTGAKPGYTSAVVTSAKTGKIKKQ